MNKARNIFSKTVVAGGLLSGLVACSNPTDQEYVDQAVQLLEAGDVTAAAIELKNAVRGNPQNRQARFLLGQTYLDMGQVPEAEKELRRTLELGADKSEILPLLASTLILQGKYDDVIREFSFLDEGLEPMAAASIQGTLGRAYIQKGEYEKAEFAFESALERVPNSREALLGKSSLLALQGDIEQAQQLNKQVREQYPTFVEGWAYLGVIEQMRSNDPGALIAYDKAIELSKYPRVDNNARRAFVKVRLGDYEGALQDIELLREYGYEDYPYVNFVTGVAYFRQQEFAAAEESLRKAVDRSPKNIEASIFLTITYIALGNIEQAQQLAEKLFATLPNNPLSSRLISAVYTEGKNYTEAREILNTALQTNPDSLPIMRMLGIVALMDGDARGGLSYFDQVLALDPEASGVKEMRLLAKVAAGEPIADELAGDNLQSREGYRVYFLHAISLLAEGDVDEALKISQALNKAEPDNPEALNLIAGCHVATHDWERAKGVLKTVLDIAPDNASATHTLAQIELLHGDPFVTDAILSRYLALSDKKGQPRTYLLLSDAKTVTGDLPGAEKTLLTGIEKFPKDTSLTLALARNHLRAGDIGEARDLLEDISEEQGRDEPGLWELRGKAAVLLGDAPGAERAFQRWLDVAPEDPRALNFYADSLVRNNKPEESLVYFARSIDRNENYLDPRIGEVTALIAIGDSENALIALTEIKRRFKETPDIYWVDGRLATIQGDYAHAEALLAQADAKLDSPMLALDLARAQWLGGDEEQAVQTLSDWISEHPADITVRVELAAVYMGREDTDKAIIAYKEILEIAPRHGLALNNLASIYRETDPQAARNYAEKAYVVLPNNPHVQDTLGMLLIVTGTDVPRGVELIRQAVEANPENTEFREHLAEAMRKQE